MAAEIFSNARPHRPMVHQESGSHGSPVFRQPASYNPVVVVGQKSGNSIAASIFVSIPSQCPDGETSSSGVGNIRILVQEDRG